MIVQAKVKLFVPCPNCPKDERADQLTIGQSTMWTCSECHNQIRIKRINEFDYETESTGRKETPITVTLISDTVPPIELKLNTWKYAHSQDLSQYDFVENQRYFYNQHTCPINWTRDIEEMKVGEDRDPHGIFQFVSVEDGHYECPC